MAEFLRIEPIKSTQDGQDKKTDRTHISDFILSQSGAWRDQRNTVSGERKSGLRNRVQKSVIVHTALPMGVWVQGTRRVPVVVKRYFEGPPCIQIKHHPNHFTLGQSAYFAANPHLVRLLWEVNASKLLKIVLDALHALYKHCHSCYALLPFPNTTITKQLIKTISASKEGPLGSLERIANIINEEVGICLYFILVWI